MPHFWSPKIDKKVINSSTKCLISVKIAILTPHIITLLLVNVWLIFDLQKYVNWLCVFLEVNPCFQRAHVVCMDLQPPADPYNVVYIPCVFYIRVMLWCTEQCCQNVKHPATVNQQRQSCKMHLLIINFKVTQMGG